MASGIRRHISLASTNAVLVESRPVKVTGVQVSNVNAAARYLKLYDSITPPVVGTDIPVATFPIGGSGGVNSIVSLVLGGNDGVPFQRGLAFAITAGLADTDTAVIGAGDVVVHLFYKPTT